MTDRTCSVEGCPKAGEAGRGWCWRHWRSWRLYGDPLHLDIKDRTLSPKYVEALKAREDVELLSWTTKSAKAHWRCTTCGYEWWTTFGSVLGGGRGCTPCNTGKRDDMKRSRFEGSARERLEARGYRLVNYMPGGRGKSLIICPQGHEWKILINNALSGYECPDCNTAFPRPRRWTEDACREQLAENGIELISYGGVSNRESHLRCSECGHTWSSTDLWANLNLRTGCRKCAATARTGVPRRWTDEAVREVLTEKRIHLLNRESEVLDAPGTLQCGDCGHTWSVRSMVSVVLKSGCPDCAEYGFSPNLPAKLYVMRHDIDQAWKIGITRGERRKLRADGWTLVKEWHYSTGEEARRIEREVIRRWRGAGLPPGRPRDTEGYTETVAMASIDLSEIIRAINSSQAVSGAHVR